jgi:4-hydroxy-3-polyprenylbenzoate decarboxylase
MLSLGTPPDDASVAAALSVALSIKRRLKKHNIPIVDVSCPSDGVCHLAVVSVSNGGIEVAKKIRDIFVSRRVFFNKLIVVDKDVDVFNVAEVMHAFATKCHSTRGIVTIDIEEGKANRLTPAYSEEERTKGKGAFALFDATWPPAWSRDSLPIKNSFDTIYPQDLRERVVKNWSKFGFK